MAKKPIERVFWVAGCDNMDFGPTLAKVTAVEVRGGYDITKTEWVMGDPLYTKKIPRCCTANPPSGPVKDGVHGALSWHDTPQGAMQAIRDYIAGRQKWIVAQIEILRGTSVELERFDLRVGEGIVERAVCGDAALDAWLQREMMKNHARIRSDLMGGVTDEE